MMLTVPLSKLARLQYVRKGLSSSVFACHPLLPFAASRINWAISSGCETGDAWLELSDNTSYQRSARREIINNKGHTFKLLINLSADNDD